jgi:hypothetical protein
MGVKYPRFGLRVRISPVVLKIGKIFGVNMKKKISKSDMPHKDIVITDYITISSLKSEVNYWKTRYELLKKYKEG